MDDIEKRLEEIKKLQKARRNQMSRKEGRKSQDKAKKLLDIPDSPLGKDSDEEFWNTEKISFEVKSGKQVHNTMSMFEKAETQSWEYQLTKDNPKELFSMIMMPHGTNDGIILIRLSDIKQVVLELQHMWNRRENGMDKE